MDCKGGGSVLAIKDFFMRVDYEFLVADILLVVGIVYYIPKFIFWLIRVNKHGLPPDINYNVKPKGPQDYS